MSLEPEIPYTTRKRHKDYMFELTFSVHEHGSKRTRNNTDEFGINFGFILGYTIRKENIE